MEIKGLSDLRKKLDTLASNAKDLGNTKSASLTDILTAEFIARHTKFANADELFADSGFDVSGHAAFEAIPEDKLDTFINSVSSFGSWREMLNSAGAAWAKRKLGL
jgi:hypothetical protein